MSEEDKPRFCWSATEIVGIGIDNPERIRKTEDGLTVLMPTDFSIGVISEWTPPEREIVVTIIPIEREEKLLSQTTEFCQGQKHLVKSILEDNK